ncbi:cytochrome c biogenesis protein CcmA [Mycobacteroides abscessus subsp. abscessus]|uniref:AAA family ATPase n=1 Tax=Mycobacteroides abscessus TaxID=36809 RepID=UPI00092974FB|nr:AAA family ATPase [Mycobacteroides abscessus]SIF22359.1 cytochrome c biogenesis protein CcmA [Mycobacteroides abscessus subsp. abscessus]
MSEVIDNESMPAVDPRTTLAEWANEGDEWVRAVVAEIISSGRSVSEDFVSKAYSMFRQEKGIDARTLPAVPPLSTEAGEDEKDAPLTIVRLSEVHGVNALISGEVIEPHQGLTILHGENGTGKTGYSRIFKALANSRTADEILSDIAAEDDEPPTAVVDYALGDDEHRLEWSGTRGVSPFTRMSIFDSPSVAFHVDEDLEYVYTPAALALFNYVNAGIQGVQKEIDSTIVELESGALTLLARFPKDSTVYPLIETLGASTDLDEIKKKLDNDPKITDRIEILQQAVAALQSNSIGPRITTRQRDQRVLQQATTIANLVRDFDLGDYNTSVRNYTQLQSDYEKFRTELFAAADLPAEPEETWSTFVMAGEAYRQHLVAVESHDDERCLYCRQHVDGAARELLTKYATYLEDRISTEIRRLGQKLASCERQIDDIASNDVESFVNEYVDKEDKPKFYAALTTLVGIRNDLVGAAKQKKHFEVDIDSSIASASKIVSEALDVVSAELADLASQSENRISALAQKRSELTELTAAAEVAKSWPTIDAQVKRAKEADRLKILRAALPKMQRAVTALAKVASDQMINQSFDALFAEEREALRAPTLKIQFVGREGKAQRRKVLSRRHRPSKILSEGEQKVIALADFLAEARLAGITAPIIFDDPVSSLDHRRVDEVAQRIAKLAEHHQVIVFTHDILFTTKLLSLFERSKRCTYFQVTDDDGKGKVTHATGPRWDTLKNFKTQINSAIQAAKSQDGEARAALIIRGYSLIRSWCEVFTETELLRGVTQRYQPNVGMTRLSNINTEKLPELIETVVGIFEEACRYIDGHSQPLPTLGVSPTLAGLEEHWERLQACVAINEGRTPS